MLKMYQPSLLSLISGRVLHSKRILLQTIKCDLQVNHSYPYILKFVNYIIVILQVCVEFAMYYCAEPKLAVDHWPFYDKNLVISDDTQRFAFSRLLLYIIIII